jgi:GGDEF domain-containing protein
MYSMVDAILDLHRLAVLHDLEILDTPPELIFDDVATLASSATGSPIAAVNFVDGDRHWTKAAVGVSPAHGAVVSDDLSFCAATVRSGRDLLCIPDTMASMPWREHPLVVGGPELRFYAGATVFVSRQPIGVVCIYGFEPRSLSRQDERSLLTLARQVASQLEQRRHDCRLLTPGFTDSLTGVANRRLLFDRLEVAIADRRRRGGEVGVLRCSVNDARRERPELADRHLTTVAERLVRSTDDGDTVARSAPHEFTVVMPGLTRDGELDASLSRIRTNLQISDGLDDPPHDAGPSLYATLVRDGETAASVLGRSDAM